MSSVYGLLCLQLADYFRAWKPGTPRYAETEVDDVMIMAIIIYYAYAHSTQRL